MTVENLIHLLSTQPKDAEVLLRWTGHSELSKTGYLHIKSGVRDAYFIERLKKVVIRASGCSGNGDDING